MSPPSPLRWIIGKLPYQSWVRAFIEDRSIDIHERHLEISNLLSSLLGSPSLLLDVGAAGSSKLQPYLKVRGHFVLSLDVRRVPGLDVVASASHLPFGEML